MTAGSEAEARWVGTFPKAGICGKHLWTPAAHSDCGHSWQQCRCPVREVALKLEQEGRGFVSPLLCTSSSGQGSR